METILSVRNIQVDYDGVIAVRDLSMEVCEYSIVAIVGGNGAGKSSVLRAISGLVRLMVGEIWFEKERIHNLPTPEIVRRGVVHVPEGRRVFPYMTVLDNLLMGAYLRRDREMIKNELNKILYHFPGLNRRLKQKAGKLSGGEQQMLAIGRALMGAPKLMLLDEPTLGLAPMLVKEASKIIKDINREQGVTILLIEQNAKMALTTAELGYVLENGTIVLEGDTRNLINNEHVRKIYLGEFRNARTGK